MSGDFSIELKDQQEWSWLVAVDLFLGGLGGALFVFFVLFDLPSSIGLLSLGLVMAGGLVLLAELGHPLRAWRAFCKPFSSWISRGVILVLLFLISGSLYAAPGADLLSWLPWAPGTFGGRVLGGIAGVSALMVTVYPGFVLSASPSIPFWNSPFLPVLFLFNSATGASGILLLFSPFVFMRQSFEEVSALAALLIVANFVLLFIYLLGLSNSGMSAKESVRRLREGSLGWVFQGGVALTGTLIPLLILFLIPSGASVAGGCVLLGGLLYRYCVLKAGVYVPFALT